MWHEEQFDTIVQQLDQAHLHQMYYLCLFSPFYMSYDKMFQMDKPDGENN